MSLIENIKLGVFDTLHDFWKERKLSKNDQEDDDDEPIDEGKQYALRVKLAGFLSTYLELPNKKVDTSDPGNLINGLLRQLSNDKVSSVTSNYERSVLKYYEESSSLRDSLHYRTVESLRYGDIIESYIASKGNPSNNILLQKYINSNGSNYILELSCGDHKKYSSFGMIQKNPTFMGYIANFILNYYYPNITSAKYNGYFTFDAKPGVVGKTFRDIPEIYQLVTPANIADSAVTTFKALNNRNEYFFPDREWEFDSNYYTKDSVSLKFLRSLKGFDVKNQFGFSLQVQKKVQTNNIIKKFDFSSNQKQGPSVNYLVDLMLVGQQAKPNVGSILNISQLVASNELKEVVNNGLLFDIKRGGDYEQVNFARYSNTKGKPTIFSTIDILCSLYARTLAQNTVWHNGEKMTLYRFPSVAIDPALLEFNNMKHKSIDLIQELEIIQKFIQPNGLSSDINSFMEKILFFYSEGIYLETGRKKGQPQMVRSETIVTILIKIRLIDIMLVLGNLSNMISLFSIPEITNKLQSVQSDIKSQIEYLKEFSKIEDMRLVPSDMRTNISSILTSYENLPNIRSIMDSIKGTFDLSPNQVKLLYTGENPLGLNYVFPLGLNYVFFSQVNQVNIFNVTGTYQEMRFSNKLYANLYDTLNKFERMVSSVSSRGSKNLYDKLHKMDYFTFINNLYQSYFSKEIAEEVYNSNQPQMVTTGNQSPTSDEACVYWFENVTNELTRILLKYQEDFESKYPSIKLGTPKYNLPSSGGSVSIGEVNIEEITQKGGNSDLVVQIYELSDLLRLISGTAAQFIESFITESFNSIVPSLDELISRLMETKNYDICKETLNEILFLFANGLMTIQNQKNEGYDYEPTSTEFELLFCLSYMYDQTGNSVEYFYIDANNNYYGEYRQALETKTSSIRSKTSTRTSSSISSTGRGTGLNITRLQDIYNIYNTSTITLPNNPSKIIPAEILTLLVLTLIDNTMQNINMRYNPNPKIGYFYSILGENKIPSTGFDDIPSWDKLMDYYYVYLYIISRSKDKPHAFRASINQIRALSGGKNTKTKKNIVKRKQTRRNK
jgi:hypothetical protein